MPITDARWSAVAVTGFVGGFAFVTWRFWKRHSRERQELQPRVGMGAPWLLRNPRRFYPWLPPRGVMNLRPTVEESFWLDVDGEYLRVLELKGVLLAASPHHVSGSIADPRVEIAERDVLALIVQDLDKQFPGLIHIASRRVTNRVTGLSWDLDETPALTIAAQLVQEDLVVLLPDGDEGHFFFAAGNVCFADRWKIETKLGKSVRDIHSGVPHYQGVADSVDTFLRNLKVGDDVRVRYNFTFVHSSALHLREEVSIPVSLEGPGNAVAYLRVERQGFRTLPESKGILFTIRTYLSRVDEIPNDAQVSLRSVFSGKVRTTYAGGQRDEYMRAVLAELRA